MDIIATTYNGFQKCPDLSKMSLEEKRYFFEKHLMNKI